MVIILNLELYLGLYFILINVISFFVMGIDKNKARNKEMRISEKTIFTLAIFLGAIGIYAGMQKYRHKTKHFKFVVFIPILIILNLISLYYIYVYFF